MYCTEPMTHEDMRSELQSKIITEDGYPPHPENLSDTEDGMRAVLPDDRIVMLIESTRIRVGNSGAGASSLVSVTWFWDEKRIIHGPPGLYKLLRGWREAVKMEWVVRCATQKRPRKSWLKTAEGLSYQLMSDFELAEEIIAEGAAKWLSTADLR